MSNHHTLSFQKGSLHGSFPYQVTPHRHAYHLKFSLPGVPPENANLAFDYELNQLSLSATFAAHSGSQSNWFSKCIQFPQHVKFDESKTLGTWEHGLLQITLVRATPLTTRSKQIPLVNHSAWVTDASNQSIRSLGSFKSVKPLEPVEYSKYVQSLPPVTTLAEIGSGPKSANFNQPGTISVHSQKPFALHTTDSTQVASVRSIPVSTKPLAQSHRSHASLVPSSSNQMPSYAVLPGSDNTAVKLSKQMELVSVDPGSVKSQSSQKTNKTEKSHKTHQLSGSGLIPVSKAVPLSVSTCAPDITPGIALGGADPITFSSSSGYSRASYNSQSRESRQSREGRQSRGPRHSMQSKEFRQPGEQSKSKKNINQSLHHSILPPASSDRTVYSHYTSGSVVLDSLGKTSLSAMKATCSSSDKSSSSHASHASHACHASHTSHRSRPSHASRHSNIPQNGPLLPNSSNAITATNPSIVSPKSKPISRY